MRNTVSKEYEEEDLDLDSLLEGSCSQLEDSVMDLDSILRPLSDSQHALEADLDMKDQEIRNQIATQEERNVLKEQEEVMLKHKKIPTQIRRSPPGLSVFQFEQHPVFSFTDLSLERDFGWDGRKRLEESGLDSSFVDRLVGGKHPVMMVRYLAPETGQNNMVANKEDFASMVDYLFFMCSVCQDKLTFSVLSKCLFDLLKSCGYPWHLTTSHFLATLLNLGAREDLLASQHFYRFNLKTIPPAMPRFYQLRQIKGRRESQVDSCINQKSRLTMIKNILQLTSDLLRMPDRSKLDTTSLLSIAYLAATCGQDPAVVDNPTITRPISELLNTVVAMLSSSHDSDKGIQDLTEILSAGFLPGLPNMCPASITTWSYTSLPPYLAEAGHNHPHNMLATCLVLPPHSPIRHLVCYVYTQLVLGVTSVDLPLPDSVTVTDLVNMLDTHKMLWKRTAREHHYSMWAVLGFMDLMVEGTTDELRAGSDQYHSMKKLINMLEQYLTRANMNDPLNLDPVIVGETAQEMASRWKLAVNRASHIHSMRLQTGQALGEDEPKE